jgi:hypothetical protein
MTEIERNQPERYYRAYQRTAVVCLLFAVAVGGFFLAVGSGALSGGAAQSAALSLVVLFAVAFLAVPAVTLRGAAGAPAIRRRSSSVATSGRDGTGTGPAGSASAPCCGRSSRSRSSSTASRPSPPSRDGGAVDDARLGAFWATYLYVGRQPADE